MDNEKRSDVLILVGGASGAGKTSIARAIEEQGIAVYRKIHELALDIVREKGGDVKTTFEQLDDSMVIERIIAITKEHHSVVSDLHFAIQPLVDTAFLIEGRIDDEKLMTEKYEPAFKVAELSRIIDCGITLVPVLVTCDVDTLISRRAQITTRISRSLRREIILQECTAELETYFSTVEQLDLQPQIFVNADNQFDEFRKELTIFLTLKTEK